MIDLFLEHNIPSDMFCLGEEGKKEGEEGVEEVRKNVREVSMMIEMERQEILRIEEEKRRLEEEKRRMEEERRRREEEERRRREEEVRREAELKLRRRREERERIQRQIDEVKRQMAENIELVLDRSERLECLDEKCDLLETNSMIFSKQAQALPKSSSFFSSFTAPKISLPSFSNNEEMSSISEALDTCNEIDNCMGGAMMGDNSFAEEAILDELCDLEGELLGDVEDAPGGEMAGGEGEGDKRDEVVDVDGDEVVDGDGEGGEGEGDGEGGEVEGEGEGEQKEGQKEEDQVQEEQQEEQQQEEEQEDFTLLPKVLDKMYETHDKEGAVRAITIKIGETWTHTSSPSLLSSPTKKSLSQEDQKKEKNQAFDLLDVLSRSGELPLSHTSFHVLLASSHSLPQTLEQTLLKKNINPIDRVEKAVVVGVVGVMRGGEKEGGVVRKECEKRVWGDGFRG